MHAGCPPALLAVCALLTGCRSSQATRQGPLSCCRLGPGRSHLLPYCWTLLVSGGVCRLLCRLLALLLAACLAINHFGIGNGIAEL